MGPTRSEREMLDFLSNGKKKREKEERRKQEDKIDEKMRQEELRSIRKELEENMTKLDELIEQNSRNTKRWEE